MQCRLSCLHKCATLVSGSAFVESWGALFYPLGRAAPLCGRCGVQRCGGERPHPESFDKVFPARQKGTAARPQPGRSPAARFRRAGDLTVRPTFFSRRVRTGFLPGNTAAPKSRPLQKGRGTEAFCAAKNGLPRTFKVRPGTIFTAAPNFLPRRAVILSGRSADAACRSHR